MAAPVYLAPQEHSTIESLDLKVSEKLSGISAIFLEKNSPRLSSSEFISLQEKRAKALGELLKRPQIDKIHVAVESPPPDFKPLKLDTFEELRKSYDFAAASEAVFVKVRYYDKLVFKLLACMPVIGVGVDYFVQKSLATDLKKSSRDERISLLATQNHYRIASIVRNILSIAILVSGIASGVFDAAGMGYLAGIHALFAYQNIREYTSNIPQA